MKSRKLKGYLQLTTVILFIVGSTLLSLWIGRSGRTLVETGGPKTAFFVDTQTVVSEPYQVTFTTTGVVQARTTVQVVPQVSGRVLEVHPEFSTGGTFRSGEVLFQIDPAEYKLEIDRLEAEVARAETALELEKAEAGAARAEWNQQNGDVPTTPLAARDPQLREAQANVKAAQANLENAKLRLERTTFRLPKAGRVMASHIAVGQFVQAGAGYGEVFYVDSLEVTASLSGRELDWIVQAGQPGVEFQVHELGKQVYYKGKLSRQAVMLNTATRFGSVHFDFIEQPEDLLPGSFVDVTIMGPVLDDISLLPVSAVQQDGQVWVLDGSNRLHPVQPDIVHRTDDWIAVRRWDGNSPAVTSSIRGATAGSLAVNRSRAQYDMAYDSSGEKEQ